MGIPTEYVAFSSRASRSDFVAHRFADYLQGSILDVGCDQAPLHGIFRSSYTGIDIAGKPDIKIDLSTGFCLRWRRGVLCGGVGRPFLGGR